MRAWLVFDLDGTLVESLPGIAEGLNRALAAVGREPLLPSAVRGMIGRGAANLCAAALGYADASLAPAEELELLHAAFSHEYPQCWQAGTVPFAGIPNLLALLAAAGARLAVLSNKPHEVTEVVVRTLFPNIPFNPILGYTEAFPRKPAPDALLHIARQWGVEPAELTLVGDSPYDARTAANAGAGCVLVDWGYATSQELTSCHVPLCHSVMELSESLGVLKRHPA